MIEVERSWSELRDKYEVFLRFHTQYCSFNTMH